MKIMYFILPFILICGCWSDISSEYEHEIRCRKYSEIPQCVTNCIKEVESHGFFVTKLEIEEFIGVYCITVKGVNYQRYLDKHIFKKDRSD